MGGGIGEGPVEKGLFELSLKVQVELSLVEGMWMTVAEGEQPGGGTV